MNLPIEDQDTLTFNYFIGQWYDQSVVVRDLKEK